MAYDEFLADRMRRFFDEKKVLYIDKKMMGGLCFMVDDKMCAGIVKNQVMARIGLEAYSEALKKEGCNEMNFTGRAMKGFVFLDMEAIDTDEDLAYWLQLCLDFNPFAKSSKKKKKKKS